VGAAFTSMTENASAIPRACFSRSVSAGVGAVAEQDDGPALLHLLNETGKRHGPLLVAARDLGFRGGLVVLLVFGRPCPGEVAEIPAGVGRREGAHTEPDRGEGPRVGRAQVKEPGRFRAADPTEDRRRAEHEVVLVCRRTDDEIVVVGVEGDFIRRGCDR